MDIEMIKEKIGDLDLKNVFDEKSKLITEINSCRNAISKAKGQKEQLQVSSDFLVSLLKFVLQKVTGNCS